MAYQKEHLPRLSNHTRLGEVPDNRLSGDAWPEVPKQIVASNFVKHYIIFIYYLFILYYLFIIYTLYIIYIILFLLT